MTDPPHPRSAWPFLSEPSPSASASRSAPEPVPLDGAVVPVAGLDATTRRAMRTLLAAHFDGVTEAAFDADLAEKESVLLLRDAEGALRGFSTLLRWTTTLDDGAPVVVYFSGDTLVDRAAWGTSALPRLWSRHVFARAAADAPTPAYWFLIASGYKTYRFLPTFFRRFHPTPTAPTPPAVQRLLDRVARERYGDRYADGVVRLAHATPLRAGVADIDARRRADPFVAFFERVNPGHAAGDELACLTRLDPANVTDAGRRMLGLPPES